MKQNIGNVITAIIIATLAAVAFRRVGGGVNNFSAFITIPIEYIYSVLILIGIIAISFLAVYLLTTTTPTKIKKLSSVEKSLWKEISGMLVINKWDDVKSFSDNTGLDRRTYTRIKNKERDISFYTAITLCISFNYNLDETQAFLRKAGYTLNDSPRHLVYKHVINNMRNCEVPEKFAYLKKRKVEGLGFTYKIAN